MQSEFLTFFEKKIRIDYIYEHRSSLRMAIKHDKVIVRLPLLYPKALAQNSVNAFLTKHISKKPGLLSKLAQKKYPNHFQLTVCDQRFQVSILPSSLKSHKAAINRNTNEVRLFISNEEEEVHRYDSCTKMLSRVFAKHFRPHVLERVNEINKELFQVSIARVSLKYNKTNWGSCSAKGNINLSTRLLLAPDWVLDSVVAHELNHRLHMDHSAAFWASLEKRFPRYKEADQWLKHHGQLCDFYPFEEVVWA